MCLKSKTLKPTSILKKRAKLATRIERDFNFQAGVYFEGNFIMAVYDITLGMDVETDSIHEQNIAMDRINYFLSECVANSIFVEAGEKQVIQNYVNADIKVCTMPEEPYDQILALLMIVKLNAITEGRLVVTDLVLDSSLSDGVRFTYDIESASMHPFGKKGWWQEPTCSITDLKISKKDKVVRLKKKSDWTSAGLEWTDSPVKSAEIIFTADSEKQP